MVRDWEQCVPMPETTQPSRQALNGERLGALYGNALDYTQPPGQALNGERQWEQCVTMP